VNRKPLIVEAMGLGPIWQRRIAPDDALPCWLDVAAIATDSPSATTEDYPPAADTAPPLGAVGPTEPDSEAVEPAAVVLAATPSPAQKEEPLSAIPPLSDWQTLQSEVQACLRCRLGHTRTNAVFGRGKPGARWLLVGEAPGEQEDKQGLPFVGRAGKLLDNMLSAAGLSTEDDVYIANVLKCRPPGNRNPQGDEIAACQTFLHQQIAHIQPEIIVALGRFAAQTLLETGDSISRLRGRVHSYRGTPMIVTFHPAYLLRNPPDKSKAWQDWVLAKNTLNKN
jgi:uracil-DNA glycosylase